MPLDRRETRDWLRPGGPTCPRPNPTPHHSTTDCTTTPHGIFLLFSLWYVWFGRILW
uniref:Uncharacterized protein n=1 Tax=Mesocestoides corti TaxID=53468 RepID=A0A5K3G0E2_MESCO